MPNGKPQNQGERITAVETEVRNLKDSNREEHGKINDKLETIIVALAPIEAVARKVDEHHIDLKEIKPTVKTNKKYIEKLDVAGCPAVKVTPEDLLDSDRTNKTNTLKTWVIAIAVISLIITNLLALYK